VYCLACRTEYREGFDRCADCGAPLVPEPPPAEIPPHEDWTQLRVVSTETEAKLIQGYLQSEGVPCALESLVFHAEPFNFGPLAQVRVHVPAARVDKANRLLDRLAAADEPLVSP